MRIQVKLYSRFRDRLPPEARGRAALELPEGSTVADLLAHLGIEGRIEWLSVNEVHEPDVGRTLHDGDEVSIFPPVAGG